MPETWQIENANGNGVVPSTGLPHRTEELAVTSVLEIPSALAKKRETVFGALPVSFAPVVTVTVRPVLSREMDLTPLLPSKALPWPTSSEGPWWNNFRQPHFGAASHHQHDRVEPFCS
jgi:hypothetical protein